MRGAIPIATRGQVGWVLHTRLHPEGGSYCREDGDEDVSDGFFYTVGYKDMSGAVLMRELMLTGICSISLSLTGSAQAGVRICVSQLNRPEQLDLLENRLGLFASSHP